jgi:hypothetical protein
MHTWSLRLLAWSLCSLLTLACGSAPDDALGSLTLGLTTQASGVVYRLADARFKLEGPSERELVAMGENELSVSLPAGAYRLTLLDGYRLTRADGADATPITAHLISQNPAPVLIAAGEVARVTLRFDLGDKADGMPGEGTLRVDVAVGREADAGDTVECALGLRINELDYEQARTDASEFVELLNPGGCSAQLAGLTVELVNGSDLRPYARYALGDAAPSLPAGERLVIGDADVLAALPPTTKRLMLTGSGLQNGPDAVRLVHGEHVIDAIAYKEPVSGSGEGAPAPLDDGALALARCPDGFDTQDNARDVQLAAPTPGAANQCSAGDQKRSATMPSSMSQR